MKYFDDIAVEAISSNVMKAIPNSYCIYSTISNNISSKFKIIFINVNLSLDEMFLVIV